MTTSRYSELKQAFDALLNATTALEICNGVVSCHHYQEGKEGEPLQLHHHSDIAPYEPVEIAHRRVETDWQTMENWVPRQVRDHFGVEGSIYQAPGLIEAYDQAIQVLEQIDKPIRDLDDTELTLFEKSIEIDRLLIFFKFGALLIKDFAERIELIHSKWLDAREYVTNMPHPLTPIVKAWWLQELRTKNITAEYDRKHSVAIIEKSVLGSIRDVVLDVEEDGNLPIITDQTPARQQLEIWNRRTRYLRYCRGAVCCGTELA